MSRRQLDHDVMRAGYDRLRALYDGGHKLVVAFSGGKDSTVCLELAVMAARDAGRLPVEVIVQDEEIAYPGTYEFIERTAARPEVHMTWLVMQQALINAFDRDHPYWWVFDPTVDPALWVRHPPAIAEWVVEEKAIELMVNPIRYPVPQDLRRRTWDPDYTNQKLLTVMGLRVQESSKRAMGLHSSGGYISGSNDLGVYGCRPIYDWKDGDVWRFIRDGKFDYNDAYDVMLRMGVPRGAMRIGPPTLNAASIRGLAMASRAWPKWFDRVCARIPGTRTAAAYGPRVVQPHRRYGETWEQCFYRECVEEAPAWVRDRAMEAQTKLMSKHAAHAAGQPFPESVTCRNCGMLGSWRALAHVLWSGDPIAQKSSPTLGLVEPEFFRQGAGLWAGSIGKQFGLSKVKVLM